MVRVKRGVTSHASHKKILKLSKGYTNARSRSYRSANQAVIKALQYAYRDRKNKKRYFRKTWIQQINAETRKYNLSYNKFIYKIKKHNININRKLLVNLIHYNNDIFKQIIKKITSPINE